jgi:hypothetical protein
MRKKMGLHYAAPLLWRISCTRLRIIDGIKGKREKYQGLAASPTHRNPVS